MSTIACFRKSSWQTVQGDNLSVYGSLVEANAAKETRIPRDQFVEAARVKHTVRQYLVALEQQNPVEEPVHQPSHRKYDREANRFFMVDATSPLHAATRPELPSGCFNECNWLQNLYTQDMEYLCRRSR